MGVANCSHLHFYAVVGRCKYTEGHARGWGACLVKTLMTVKTNATPRPIVDSDHLNGLSGLNGLYTVASAVGISEVYKQR